jgi:predicted GNAT family acetyltransferase
MSTSDPAHTASVRDNPEQQRFEMETAAGLAVAEYRRDGDTLVIFHTEVPAALRGQGMGDKLVRGLLDDVRRRRLKIVPRCWFFREFVTGNPEYGDLIE